MIKSHNLFLIKLWKTHHINAFLAVQFGVGKPMLCKNVQEATHFYKIPLFCHDICCWLKSSMTFLDLESLNTTPWPFQVGGRLPYLQQVLINTHTSVHASSLILVSTKLYLHGTMIQLSIGDEVKWCTHEKKARLKVISDLRNWLPVLWNMCACHTLLITFVWCKSCLVYC